MKSIKEIIMDYIDVFVSSAMAILLLACAIVWYTRGCIIFSIICILAFIFYFCIAIYKYKNP